MGHNSVNTVHGVTVLALCTVSDHGLYLYQVLSKYLKRFKSYGANTISIPIIQREINPKILHVEYI